MSDSLKVLMGDDYVPTKYKSPLEDWAERFKAEKPTVSSEDSLLERFLVIRRYRNFLFREIRKKRPEPTSKGLMPFSDQKVVMAAAEELDVDDIVAETNDEYQDLKLQLSIEAGFNIEDVV